MEPRLRKLLDDETIVAFAIRGNVWPSGLLSSTMIPDKWMGLVVSRDGRRRLAPAGEDPRPDSDDRLLLIRNRPFTTPIAVEDVVAKDRHPVSARAELLVQWAERPDDLAALLKTLLRGDVLRVDDLAKAVADGGGADGLSDFIRARTAAELVNDDHAAAFAEVAETALQRFCFETGLTLARVATLHCESPTLAQQRRHERESAQRLHGIHARSQVEAAAAAALGQRLESLAGVLDKLKQLASTDESTRWHALLPALSPVERDRLLENLWRVSPRQHTARAIIAVAGHECLWLDPANPESLARRVALPDDLGPLRCVSFEPEQDALLVGAAWGVWLIDAQTGDVRSRFATADDARPRTGFNAAAIVNDSLYATHSQLGCWSWPLAEPNAATALLVPASGAPRAIRAATALPDGRLAFTADACLHLYEPRDAATDIIGPVGDTLRCLTARDRRLYAGTNDGRVLRIDLTPAGGSWITVHQSPEPIASIATRRWSDLIEIVIPGGLRGVLGVFGEEAAVTTLMPTRHDVRQGWVADDAIVALTEQRDKLLVLSTAAARATVIEAPLGRLTGRSIQDACIVTTQAQVAES